MLLATCSSLVGYIDYCVWGGVCSPLCVDYESFSPISRSLCSVLFGFKRLRVTARDIYELFELGFQGLFLSLKNVSSIFYIKVSSHMGIIIK